MRTIALLGLVAVLAVVIVLILPARRSASVGSNHVATRHVESASVGGIGPTDVESEERPQVAEAGRVVPRRAQTIAAEATSPSPAPRTTLTGTIVAVDELGIEHRHEDGLVVFEFGSEGRRVQAGAQVRNGSWSVDLARMRRFMASGLVVESCTLGERAAISEPAQAQPIPIPAEGDLELRVHWLADVLIHVRARDGGHELQEVFLHEVPVGDRISARDVQHPGTVVGRVVGQSPVRIARRDSESVRTRVVYIRSPGYTWGRIEIDPVTAELDLVLDRAGQLELIVDGESGHSDDEISVLSEDAERVFLEAPLERTKAFLLEGLLPGDYAAQARCHGQRVGSEQAHVAGEKSRVTLFLQPPSGALVPLEGTLTLPAGWPVDDFTLDLGLQGRFSSGV